MTPEQWQAVTSIFAECLEAPPQTRDRILEECNASEEIRREVRRLLDNLSAAGSGFLEHPSAAAELEFRLKTDDLLLNRFRILRRIGTGGMGEVYEARDEQIGESVALKVVRAGQEDSPEFSSRLRRELQLARRIAHPNVCRLFDLNRDKLKRGEIEFLTMELLSGVSLTELLKQRGSFSPEEALPYFVQILGGLQAAHTVGIVHRDLKPDNVMVVTEPSGSLRCVLMDFGLARHEFRLNDQTTLTRTQGIMGTLAYMAPEQLAGGEVSPQTDLYAFGIIMYEMLKGHRPFQFREVGITERTRFAASLPKTWSSIIDQCLQPDAAKRPRSASRVASLLQYRQWITRRRVLIGGAAAAIAAAAGYGIFWDSGPQFTPGSSLLVVDPPTLDGDPIGTQLRASLRQSNRLVLWDNSRLGQVWQQMGRKDEPMPSTRDWRQVAMRESVGFVLFPSVTSVGDGTTLSLRLEQLFGSPDIPKKTWQRSFEAIDKERLFEAIDAGGRWIRDLIGESATDISNSSAQPREVTTSSWEALKEFSRAEGLMSARQPEAAILAFRSAARLDPQFTMAWMRLGDVQVSLGRENEAFTAWQRAEATSHDRPLTRREDLRFRAGLASDSADYTSAEKLYDEYEHYFPEDFTGSFYRAFPLLLLGRVTESTAEMERCLSSPKLEQSACLQLSAHYMYAGRRDAGEKMVAKLKSMGAPARAAYAEAIVAHAIGDTERSLNALNRAAKDPVLLPRARASLSLAIVLADAGRLADAVDMLRAGALEDEKAGEQERWAAKLVGLGMLMEMDNHREEALRAIEPLKRNYVGPQNTGAAAVLFARFGDSPNAERLLESIADLSYPKFRSPRLRIQAELQFAKGNTNEGLKLARQAAALEPAAYGSEYLAQSLERFASKQEALEEYRHCLKAKCFQLYLGTPAPTGSWYRASSAIRRLES
jgi:eukaryotic-like serine/threonine-protein kinase